MGRSLKVAALLAAVVLLFSTYLVGATGASGSGAGSSNSPGRKRSSHGSAVNAQELFAQNCARCHGADGQGDTPLGHVYGSPDFTDSAWWQKPGRSSRALMTAVTSGKGGMPAFKKKLSPREISALVSYVRRFRR